MTALSKFPRIALVLLALATLMMGLYSGLYDPSFNNYLAQTHNISPLARGALEFPRELPGFLVVFIFAGLVFLADTRIAALAALFIGIALWGQGFLAPDLTWIVFWMVLWSSGAHLYMAITHPIGLRLAEAGQEGKMLGQLGFLESLGTLGGMLFIYWGASLLHLSFAVIFGIAGLFAIFSAACLYFIRPEKLARPPRSLIFKQRYWLFYALNVVFGARKQIFLTFAPWVLIRVFGCGIQTFALLGFIGTILSLLFRPWLGRAIDACGEKSIIAGESVLLVIMSILYGFSPGWFSTQTAFVIVAACFVCDQLLFAVRMARTTFLYRMVDSPEDLSPTISMGLTLDHAVAMLIPMGGGLLWTRFGFTPVFIVAGLFALVNLGLALLIPDRSSWSAHQTEAS